MPWTVANVDEHNKGLSDQQKRQWVTVANKALAACLKDDGEQDTCEASAIKQANGAVKEMAEQEEPGGPEACECPDCDYETGKKRGVPCRSMECPECGAKLVAKTEGEEEETAEVLIRVPVLAVPVDGETVAVRDLIAAYRQVHEAKLEGIPEFDFSETMSATAVRQVLSFLLEQMEEETEEMAEVELAESASGSALQLAEALPAADGNRAPLLLDVVLIKPGFGNKRDNHYYPAEMLKRDAHIFEGFKMYATDHREGEKSVRTEVSQISQIIGYTDDGGPIARVAIHDPDFAEATRNRARLNTLTSLECSILATGRVKPQTVDGKKANVVEAITSAQSVDWVTRGGAGGHALNLAETEDGGNDMSDNEQQEQEQEAPVEETQETVLSEAGQEQTEAPKPLESDAVGAILKASTLPEAAQKRLAEAEYKDEAEAKAAITAEVDYLKTITGSGKPFGQGGGQPLEETRISEVDVQKRFDAIDRQHGLYVAEEAE